MCCLLVAIVNTSVLCLARCIYCQCAWHTANNTRLLQRLAFTFPSHRQWSTLYLSILTGNINACKRVAMFEDAQAVSVCPSDKTEA